MAVAITGCQSNSGDSGSGENGGGSSGDVGAKSATNDYKIPNPVRQLTLTGHAGDVTLSTGPGPITVSETIRYTDDKPVTSHTVNGGTALLNAEQCQHVRPVNGTCQVDWEIHVPVGTNLNLTSSSGDLSLSGIAGTVFAKANAGDVDARDLTSKSVVAESSSGDVRLAFQQAPDQVSATTAAGDITVGVPGGTGYAVNAQSSTDRPTITVPNDPKSPHRIKAKTSSGSIDIVTGEG